MFKTKSKSKQVPLESLRIPQQFSLVQHSRSVPGLEARGSRGSREERRINPPQSLLWSLRATLAPPGSLEWGRSAQVTLPFPQTHSKSALPLAAGGRARGRGLSVPQAPPEPQDSPGWILVLLPCATEEGGPRPRPSRPLPFAL